MLVQINLVQQLQMAVLIVTEMVFQIMLTDAHKKLVILKMMDAHGPTETEMVFQIKMINAQMKTVVLLTMDVQTSQLL